MEPHSNKPSVPKPASTLVLVREHDSEMQVFLLKRSSGNSFMPGNYVFPGGRVDEDDRDADFWSRHSDLCPEDIHEKLGGDISGREAIPYCVAAIRETFEEAGVFLIKRGGRAFTGLEKFSSRRASGRLPKGWLKELVASEGLTLSFSELRRWSHWLTPKERVQRFDTRFFLAFMPIGQECSPDARETTHGIWVTPEKGLEGNSSGDMPLSPPALVTLYELLEFKNLKTLKKKTETRTWGELRLPRLELCNKKVFLLLPWDPLYGRDTEIDLNFSDRHVLKTGESFSRLWLDNGIWRPFLIRKKKKCIYVS